MVGALKPLVLLLCGACLASFGADTDTRSVRDFGAKGGGKTAAGRIWLIRGNPDRMLLPEATPTDISYINNPKYHALVLFRDLALCEPHALPNRCSGIVLKEPIIPSDFGE